MTYYISLAVLLFMYMNVWFVLSVLKKRNDVADVAWGLGFVLIAWMAFFLSEEQGVRGLLVCVLVSVWGLRLAWHIHKRNKGRLEDYRYLSWRKEWGRWFYLRSYAQVFLLQGILLFLIVLPVIAVNKSVVPVFSWLDFVGIGTWLFGFYFEAVGDWQLAKFIQDPTNKGRLMQSGLWAYTRHPNYFGEVSQWWGLWLIATSVPEGWLTIVSPLTITFLILKISGVPMLERKLVEHPDFEAYKRRTSMFIPMRPRKILK